MMSPQQFHLILDSVH